MHCTCSGTACSIKEMKHGPQQLYNSSQPGTATPLASQERMASNQHHQAHSLLPALAHTLHSLPCRFSETHTRVPVALKNIARGIITASQPSFVGTQPQRRKPLATAGLYVHHEAVVSTATCAVAARHHICLGASAAMAPHSTTKRAGPSTHICKSPQHSTSVRNRSGTSAPLEAKRCAVLRCVLCCAGHKKPL